MSNKTILRALAGEVLPTPPIWMMRQAGRYLPEYRATRAQADRILYKAAIRRMLENQPNLWLFQPEIGRAHV